LNSIYNVKSVGEKASTSGNDITFLTLSYLGPEIHFKDLIVITQM
jgi:hypothetical protein